MDLLHGPVVPAVDVAAGVASVVLDTGRRGGHLVGRWLAPAARTARAVPVPLAVLDLVDDLSRRGRDVRHELEGRTSDVLSTVVPAALDVVLDRVDLTAVVLERVDINAIADRLDVLGLAQFVVEGIDLPLIIRQSTQSVGSEAVRSVRMSGYEADQAVTRVVDRLLRHRHPDLHPSNGAPETP